MTWVTGFSIVVTLGAYVLSRAVARRHPSPLTTPVFFSTVLTILVLSSSGVGVADYEPAQRIMVFLLGPATVSLAVPLYKSRRTLLRASSGPPSASSPSRRRSPSSWRRSSTAVRR
jgi:putative effector of murein hydrolase